MKKIFTKLMLWAVAATALVSCENNFEDATVNGGELTQTVTLSAEKPTEVRTELIEGVPYWSKGDQIGVYVQDGDTYKNYAFKNDNEEASLTTSFTGTTAVANTLFVYYPYTNFSNPVTEKGVKVEILANQEPTVASFDGRTDLMIAKPVTLDAEGNQLSDLEFARVAAIVKIVLKDKTGNLAGQHVSSLTMTAATNLVGRVYLDVVNQEINSDEGLYYGGAPSVNATYTEATQYEVNGTNATYVVVYPQTLASGSKLTIEASTEGYAISKEVTLLSDIELLAGKVTTLNVSLAAENVVKEETGLALPFKDDFARVAYDANEGGIDLSVLGENYSAMEKVYKAKVGNGGVLKLGTSSVEGYFTTVALDLSKPFTVFVEAQRYGTSTSDMLQITVGSQVLTSTNLTADSKYYVFEFEAASKKEQVEIRTIKRAYINDLQIVEGHGLDVPTLPAVLTVSTAEISGVSHEGEAKTFTYSVANPVEGVSATVTDNADWITTADNNGTVTVTVAANEVEEAREGVVTVTYGDLTKTVTVKQNAKPAEGGNTGEASWVRVTSLADITAGTYVIICGNYVLLNNSGTSKQAVTTYANKGITITNNSISTTVPEECKWSFTGSNTAMTLSPINASTNLYSTKSGDGLRIGTTKDTWSFSNGSSASCFYLKSANKSTHLAVYNNQDWRSYTSATQAQSNMSLYKLVDGSSEGGETPETPAPVLSVNPTTLSFDAAAASKTVTCTIENEVSGQNVTATENVDWLSTSVSGTTVTITATENTGAEREADVTIAYDGAESKTIKVSQAAGNTGGDEPGTSEVFTLLGTDFGAQNGYTTSEASITSKTDGSIWKVWGWMKSSATATAIQFGAKTKNYILTPACTNDIATVTLTCSGSYTVALWDPSTDQLITGMVIKNTTSGTAGNGTLTFTLPAGYKQVKIISTRTEAGTGITGSNAATYIQKIVVTSK